MNEYDFSKTLDFIDEVKSKDISSNNFTYVPTPKETLGKNITKVRGSVMYVKITIMDNNPNSNETDIYKPLITFINECSRIIKCNPNYRDITYTQDGIQVIYSTPKKVDVDTVIDDASRIRTLYMIINKKFSDTPSIKISSTIGIDYGDVFMIQISSGDENKNIFWCGQTVNVSKELANKKTSDRVFISDKIYKNIKIENMRLFFQCSRYVDYYEGDIINIMMKNWLLAK